MQFQFRQKKVIYISNNFFYEGNENVRKDGCVSYIAIERFQNNSSSNVL